MAGRNTSNPGTTRRRRMGRAAGEQVRVASAPWCDLTAVVVWISALHFRKRDKWTRSSNARMLTRRQETRRGPKSVSAEALRLRHIGSWADRWRHVWRSSAATP
jgi:hypothetical protein